MKTTARLPTEAALCPKETGRLVNWREYGNELTERMSTAGQGEH